MYDNENDNALDVAKELVNEYQNIKLVQNKISKGVKYAVDVGVNHAKYDIIIITAVDEIFPIIAIERMLEHLIENDLDFISGTRYSKGGLRLGGSLFGHIFSRIANATFKFITKISHTIQYQM